MWRYALDAAQDGAGGIGAITYVVFVCGFHYVHWSNSGLGVAHVFSRRGCIAQDKLRTYYTRCFVELLRLVLVD